MGLEQARKGKAILVMHFSGQTVGQILNSKFSFHCYWHSLAMYMTVSASMQLRRVSLMISNNFPNVHLRSETWTLVSDLQSVGFSLTSHWNWGQAIAPTRKRWSIFTGSQDKSQVYTKFRDPLFRAWGRFCHFLVKSEFGHLLPPWE